MAQTGSGPATRKQRVKRYHAKTSTGCMTCRRRRVKCGEEKPECTRCQRSGIECDGYAVRNRDTSIVRLDRDVGPFLSAIATVPPSVNTSYGNFEQTAYLDGFLRRAAPMLSLTCPSKDLWTIVMPQISWHFTPVKHMVCALAILTNLQDESEAPQHQHNLDYVAGALNEYDRAMSTLGVMESPDLSSTLVFSLMAWTFVNIINNYHQAAVHETYLRSMLVDSRRPGTQISVQARLVIERIERVIGQDLRDDVTYGWQHQTHPHPNRSFTSLDEAWRELYYVLDRAARDADMLVGHNWGPIGRSLDDWRDAFEQYRYLGSASLKQKRSILLAENALATYLACMDPQSTQLWWERERDCALVLGDLESLVSLFDNHDDIRWIARAMLLNITEAAGGSDSIMLRVRRLNRVFDNSASKSRRVSDELRFIVSVEDTVPTKHAALQKARDLWIERNGARHDRASQGATVAWYQTETLNRESDT